MADCYIGEVRIFVGMRPPRNWLFCEGQLLPIAGNESLYSLLGTTYGGDGITRFAIPDLRGCVPIGQGQDPSSSNNIHCGTRIGTETVTLSSSQLAEHSHSLNTNTQFDGTTVAPDRMYINSLNIEAFSNTTDPNRLINFNQNAVSTVGGGQPHENRMPYMALHYMIATQGEYPMPTE
ncbi:MULTISPECIES: phage tail protein [Idiomarinaceae]|uniref:Tail fiber protein n=1 Tax=Pseudidiomarina fusca TaxID=2965078 RepID=A0ABU3KY25_9GAMM|nr:MULTISPECIES: tail fiber protein [Idiomarinaceae]MDT7526361.1 tail fiber protein [Pseudidiomarina sp. GXY010]MRJ43218.1 phage tail protein [Idiomarina sp. FeN1]NCU58734.1 phage tail protein [Idiomarina sp. FenA--70]NCU61430.1 phage tail protein [Idiomarina sp. FenBw--71]UUN12695.1 phage tail protein [Idiomarina loihiensis]